MWQRRHSRATVDVGGLLVADTAFMNVGLQSADGAWTWDGSQWQPTSAGDGGWEGSGSQWTARIPVDEADVAYESAAERTRRVEWSLKAFIATAIVVMLGFGLQLLAPGDFVGRSSGADSTLRVASDVLGGLGFLVEILVSVSCVVLFLMWFHRIYRNLPALGIARPHSPRWAMGVWFLPLGNIFLVPRVVQEAWDSSHGRPLQKPKGLFSYPKLDVPVSRWWMAFFGANIINRIGGNPKNGNAGDVVFASLWLLAVEALLVVSAVLAIRMVRMMQAAQKSQALAKGWVPAVETARVRRCSTCNQIVSSDDAVCSSCLSPL
jgi:hypothetical protein